MVANQKLLNMVRSIRPAPLGSLLGNLTGLSRRRTLQTNHGAFFINPLSDLGGALMEGEYEAPMAATLARYLSPGGTFIDLGANEGYFSVLASHIVGPSGSVVAVEPQDRLQSVIQTNLKLNECHNVKLVQTVISGKTEVTEISLSPSVNTGSTSLHRSVKYPLSKQSVQALTLADFVASNAVESCDLMKVDVEGAEYEIFMGSSEVLCKGIFKNIALELHPTLLARRGLSGDDIVKQIEECGYQLDPEAPTPVYHYCGSKSK